MGEGTRWLVILAMVVSASPITVLPLFPGLGDNLSLYVSASEGGEISNGSFESGGLSGWSVFVQGNLSDPVWREVWLGVTEEAAYEGGFGVRIFCSANSDRFPWGHYAIAWLESEVEGLNVLSFRWFLRTWNVWPSGEGSRVQVEVEWENEYNRTLSVFYLLASNDPEERNWIEVDGIGQVGRWILFSRNVTDDLVKRYPDAHGFETRRFRVAVNAASRQRTLTGSTVEVFIDQFETVLRSSGPSEDGTYLELPVLIFLASIGGFSLALIVLIRSFPRSYSRERKSIIDRSCHGNSF